MTGTAEPLDFLSFKARKAIRAFVRTSIAAGVSRADAIAQVRATITEAIAESKNH